MADVLLIRDKLGASHMKNFDPSQKIILLDYTLGDEDADEVPLLDIDNVEKVGIAFSARTFQMTEDMIYSEGMQIDKVDSIKTAIKKLAIRMNNIGDGTAGEPGEPGEPGAPGEDGEDGVDGVDGVDGADGKDAYEVWLEDNPGGSRDDYYDSLKGEPGNDGVSGGRHWGEWTLTDAEEVEEGQIRYWFSNGVITIHIHKNNIYGETVELLDKVVLNSTISVWSSNNNNTYFSFGNNFESVDAGDFWVFTGYLKSNFGELIIGETMSMDFKTPVSESGGSVSSIASSTYYNMAIDVGDNGGVNSSGDIDTSNLLYKSANGDGTTGDLPLVDKISYQEGLSPLYPFSGDISLIELHIKTSACRTVADSVGAAPWIPIMLWELNPSPGQNGHSKVSEFGSNGLGKLIVHADDIDQVYKFDDNHNGGFVRASLVNINFSFDENKLYGYTIGGADQLNDDITNQIRLMDAVMLTAVYTKEIQ